MALLVSACGHQMADLPPPKNPPPLVKVAPKPPVPNDAFDPAGRFHPLTTPVPFLPSFPSPF